MSHRSAHQHPQPFPASPTAGPLPFFEFMLYGADAFACASAGARLVPVARGRSLTLVSAPRVDTATVRAHRGA